jgi:hypothetical protein
LKGELKVCEDCAVATARQKNVNQDKDGSQTPGERIYLDISSIKNKCYGGSFHWTRTKFIYNLLQGIGIEIDLPIILKTENIGAMFKTHHPSFGVRTRVT